MRVVVEIASLNEDPPSDKAYSDAIFQLHWHCRERLVGLAILGNRAYLMHITEDDHRIREVYEEADSDDSDDDHQEQNGDWMSLFDPRVVEVLNEMYELSIDDDEGQDEDGD